MVTLCEEVSTEHDLMTCQFVDYTQSNLFVTSVE